MQWRLQKKFIYFSLFQTQIHLTSVYTQNSQPNEKQREEKRQTSQRENVLYVWDDITNERKLEFIGNRQHHVTIHATNGRESM